MKNGTASASRKLDIVALLAALSLFLSFVEYSIPKPIPFLKIGFANLPLLIGLRLLPPAWFFLLVLTKIITQGVISGSLVSYVILFSFCGNIVSSSVMFLLHAGFKERISFIGISIAGALVNNLMQILLARYILFGPAVWLLAPPFLLTGIIASVVLGSFAGIFFKKSRWIQKILSEEQSDNTEYPVAPEKH